MDDDTQKIFEQFRDIYCGRLTYNDDEEWIANMDSQMQLLSDIAALDFQPMENA